MADQAKLACRPPSLHLRFSVRGLLVLIFMIACGLAWLTQNIRAARIQRKAVAAIEQAGGWVVYDLEWTDSQLILAGKSLWPKWLVNLFGVDSLGNVVFVNLHDRGTDAELVQVGRLRRLKQLHRCGFAVTDAGLAHLKGLTSLQLLSLDKTRVTDAGLAHLEGLTSLKWLAVAKTKVTDAGVNDLRKALPNVKITR
jgi:hypothetical protein